MKAHHLFRSLLVAAFALLVFLFEYMTPVTPRADQDPDLAAAYPSLERPGAVFDHEEHQMEMECADCHHFQIADGVIDPNDSPDDDVACVDCHALGDRPGTTDLTDAFHLQCRTCHEKRRKGPVTCGECHVQE